MSLARFREITDKQLTDCFNMIIYQQSILETWHGRAKSANDMQSIAREIDGRVKSRLFASISEAFHLSTLSKTWKMVDQAPSLTPAVKEILTTQKQLANLDPITTGSHPYLYGCTLAKCLEDLIYKAMKENLLDKELTEKAQAQFDLQADKDNLDTTALNPSYSQ